MIAAVAILLLQIPSAVGGPAETPSTPKETAAVTRSADLPKPNFRALAGLFNSSEAQEPSSRPLAYLPGNVSPQPVSAEDARPGGPALTPYSAATLATPGAVVLADPAAFEAVRAQEHRTKLMWYSLSIAGHSAAGFDAWSTRRAVSSGRGHEANPLFKPFAGNGSIYAATQVGPTVFDYLGKRMMQSRRSWVRRMWWVPQLAGTAASLWSGAHNLHVANR